jgi:hypothetical protein
VPSRWDDPGENCVRTARLEANGCYSLHGRKAKKQILDKRNCFANFEQRLAQLGQVVTQKPFVFNKRLLALNLLRLQWGSVTRNGALREE